MDTKALDNYITAEGLDTFIDFDTNSEWKEQAHDNVSGQLDFPFPPEKSDLVRLHQSIRERKSFTVLEFGLGYSSMVIADALAKNKKEFEAIEKKPELRNNFMFQLFSVDASKEWISILKKKIPESLIDIINISHSEVHIGTYQSQVCHYYSTIPNVVPDFIYLDGPSPKDVKGSIHGINFQIDERTVMAGDILLMEPTLLPGTVIHVDGRTNNCRFMENNFKRNYIRHWNPEEDFTTYELDEQRLGKYNIVGPDFM